jgi:hypothetical protein
MTTCPCTRLLPTLAMIALNAVPIAASAQKLDPGSLTPYTSYGHTVDTDGTRIAVGAPDGPPGEGGNVVVWVRTGATWSVEATLAQTEPMFSNFGHEVVIEGTTLVATETYDDRGYVYERGASGWVEVQIIEDFDTTWGRDRMEIRGDTLVSGSTVYSRSGGVFSEAQDLGIDPSTISSLDFDGTHIVVGQSSANSHRGKVSVFRRNRLGTFVLVQELSPAGLPPLAKFGDVVAVDGNTLAVMAPVLSDTDAFLHVFALSGSTFVPAAVFEPEPGVWWNSTSLDVLGNRMVVGDNTMYSGGAFMFRRQAGVWVEDPPVLVADDIFMGGLNDNFGSTIALDANGVVVGAPDWKPDGVFESYGSAYYFPSTAILEVSPAALDLLLVAQILYGITAGGGGVIILPGTGPIPVDPEPFRLWRDLTRAQRDYVTARIARAYALLLRDVRSPEGLEILADPMAGAPGG